MIKQSLFLGESEHGPAVIPLFGPKDSVFEKRASYTLIPDVVRYIESLKPRADAQYVLVNALGAGEFYSSNVNGDWFEESGLIHRPDDWTGNPLLDAVRSRNWPYGFPCFYNAHAYAHHKNKDPSRAYGEIELAAWNDHMKRVELVVRVDKDKCERFGGMSVWDKLKAGQYVDVSMGSKVKFDICSIHADWDEFKNGELTFDRSRHSAPDEAILEYHKKLKAENGVGIRGLSITRVDYCPDTRECMNKILPDGRKVFVYNPYPKFFDISFVFIGADKTAKVMMKIAGDMKKYFFVNLQSPSAEVAEKLGYKSDESDDFEKAASDESLEELFGKLAKNKVGEIDKDVVPSQFAGKAVPVLTKSEPDLPPSALNALASRPLEQALATTTGMGIVLKPKEFQRIVLIQLGKGDVADALESRGEVFPKADSEEPVEFGEGDFHAALARLLVPLLESRSALGPFVESRALMSAGSQPEYCASTSSHPSELLRKIGGAYNGYRKTLMNLALDSQSFLQKTANAEHASFLRKSIPVSQLITPLSEEYFKLAFLDEFGDSEIGLVLSEQALSRRAEGNPLRDHVSS